MTEILFTGYDFVKNGVPFLVNKNMELIIPANRWLRYIALVRGRTQSPNTWRAYGYHMLYFFDWLEINNIEWNTVMESNLSSYRNYLESSKSARGKPLDVNTIHNYMNTVVNFYKWAYREKLIPSLPFNLEIISINREGDRGFYAHLNKSNGLMEIADIIPRREKKELPYISREQQKKLLEELLDSEDDKLLYAFMLLTGMRLEEIIKIKIHDIPEEDIFGQTKTYPLKVIGKGNKERTVYIGHPLLVELLNWRDYKRHRLAKQWGKKMGRIPHTFWLNTEGGPLTKKALWYRVSKWGEKAGFHLNPHMFRHTFAYLYYAKAKDLRALQKLLGHSQISSTEIYTHLDPEKVMETVAQLDKEIMDMFKQGKEDYGYNKT